MSVVTKEELEALGFIKTSTEENENHFVKLVLGGEFPTTPRAYATFIVKFNTVTVGIFTTGVTVTLDDPTYEQVLAALKFTNYPNDLLKGQ